MLSDDPDDVDAGALARTAQQEREFAAALRLRSWVKDLLDGPARTEWVMTPGALNNIVVGTFAKGTKTFRAALLLCDRGYAQQADMLNRSLFEHAVVAWWLLLCVEDEEEVMQALRDHRKHAGVLFERAVGDFELGPESIGLSDDEVQRLDDKFGQFGKQWHGKRLDQLVRAIEHVVDERYKTLFWKFFRIVNVHNNYTLHHSSVGVADSVVWDDPSETPDVRVGPGPEWRSQALMTVVWSYGLLVTATLRRLSPERADEFADFFDDVTRMWVELTPAQREGVGRNDPCPCGSGLKFKRCHEPLYR